MEQISFGTMRSGCFAGALQVGNEEAFSKRQAMLSRLDRRLSNFRCINLFSLQLHLDVIEYDCEVIVYWSPFSSNLKVDCEFRTIELLQMSISLKMCYVIITRNEVFYSDLFRRT